MAGCGRMVLKPVGWCETGYPPLASFGAWPVFGPDDIRIHESDVLPFGDTDKDTLKSLTHGGDQASSRRGVVKGCARRGGNESEVGDKDQSGFRGRSANGVNEPRGLGRRSLSGHHVGVLFHRPDIGMRSGVRSASELGSA
jgi:hypothetical protein